MRAWIYVCICISNPTSNCTSLKAYIVAINYVQEVEVKYASKQFPLACAEVGQMCARARVLLIGDSLGGALARSAIRMSRDAL